MSFFSVGINFSFQNTDDGKISVFLVIIETEADDKFIGNDFADIIRLEIDFAARRLIKQGAGADGFRSAFFHISREIRESSAAVDYIKKTLHILSGISSDAL